jgi:hypothetical protein
MAEFYLFVKQPDKHEAAKARGFLHCGGQRFESPPLHQEVRASEGGRRIPGVL